MSIITDVKNILKGVGIVSPQKGAQETGAPFVSPQPQIFKPIQQTPAPFVPILSPIQSPIASPLVKTNSTPYIYNPSLSPEKNIQAESRMRESQGLANPNTPLANIPFESRMRESQWLPQSTISAVPASPTPWLKIAQDSIGGLWEYIAPESADSYSEDIDNRTKYLERVEEREWNGIRAGWAKVLDFLASQSPALQLFNKIEGLEKDSQDLKLELQKAARIINQQSSEMAALKMQYDALKLANSLLGSEENKRDTKLKINSLIREIDYCIKQLSD